MIITFEVNGDGLDIYFDAEGRDKLAEKFSSLEEAGDHSHLMMETELSPVRFEADTTAMRMVTLHLLEDETEPVALERTEAYRQVDGKVIRVEYLGGVEHSVQVDEKMTQRVANLTQERKEQAETAFAAGRRARMYEQIFDAGCVRFGEFKLKSGIMSPVYCDLRMLVSAPAVLAEIGRALGEKAKEIGCDRVAGIPYGGVPIAVAASMASGIPMIYPRKEVKDHGTRNAIEGTYNAGEKVLVIDDLVTSGLSFAEAVEPLKAAGLVVEDVLVILDREQGGAKVIEKAGYKLHSLGRLSQMVEALVIAGKIEASMREAVAKFISENQFV